METDIERAVFVSRDGRRARAIRRGSRVAIGLTVLWLGALVAGAVSPGQLSLGPLPWPSVAAERADRHEARPEATRKPRPGHGRSASERTPVASRVLPSGRAATAGIADPHRRPDTRAVTERAAPPAPAGVTRVSDTTTGTGDARPPEPDGPSGRRVAPKPDAVVVSATQLAPAGTTTEAAAAPTFAPPHTVGVQAGTTSGSPAPDPAVPGAAESSGGS